MNNMIKIFPTFYLNHMNLISSWRQEENNCSQLTLQFEYTEREEIQIVFFYKVILFEYNDSTTLLRNVGVISSVVSHESAQKKNVRTNASHSWKLFPFTLIVINQNFYSQSTWKKQEYQ